MSFSGFFDFFNKRNPPSYSKGLRFYRAKSWIEAQYFFELAVIERPNHAPSYFKLGMCFFRQRKNQKARNYIERAIALAPENTEWLKQLNQVVERLKDSNPIVSVIVPVYNVEQYLTACLDSILAQSYRNLEVVCVDDGSPDDSITILRRYEAADTRVKVVRKANGGLGAARNTGVAHSTGEMIYFVDSDDTIPPRAIEHLLTSLLHSGSDFAVGSLVRDTSTGRHAPPWAQKLHVKTRTGLTLIEVPDVLKNVFAWTKMFRRQFFIDVVGGYPDGLYEDQVPSAKAYMHGKFDIIKEVVCHWRIRDDGGSITQQKAEMKDLVGRWNMIDSLTDLMASAPISVRPDWQAKIIGFDMRPYYEQVPRTSDEYWEFLQARVHTYLDSVGYDVLVRVPISDRLLAAATYHGHREDIAEILCRRESQTWKVPGIIVNGKPRVSDEYFEGLKLRPDGVVELLDMSDDLMLVQHVQSVSIGSEVLTVRGSAYLSNLSQMAENDIIGIRAISANGAREVHATQVSRYFEPATDIRASDPWNDHANSGYEAQISLAELGAGSWNLEIALSCSGVVRTAPLAIPDVAGAGRLPVFGELKTNGRWYIVRQSCNGGLQVQHTSSKQIGCDKIWAEDGQLKVRLSESCDVVEDRFIATSAKSTNVSGSLALSGGEVVVSFPIPAASHASMEWSLWCLSGKQRIPLAVMGARGLVSKCLARPYLLHESPSGNLLIQTNALGGEVTGAELLGDGLRVTGWVHRHPSLIDQELAARLYNKYEQAPSVPLVATDGDFEVLLPLRNASGNSLSRKHGYAFVLESKGIKDYWPRVSAELLKSLPFDNNFECGAMTLTATPNAGALWIRLREPFADNERSKRSQHLLQRAYQAENQPMEAVLFEAFNGKGVGDATLALSREMHRRGVALKQYWSVETLSTPVPEWATPLLRYSKRWYQVLASARLLVNNNNWPWFFNKRPYQTYLQTWHGTPLKRIGNDVPAANLSLTYRALMKREAKAWDYLIAQNEYSAQIFPHAFGYEGKILQLGYPRNDTLVDSSACATRARIRESFGLADETHVLLYAPTWRDYLKGRSGYGRVSFLDFGLLREQAGEDIVVLYRGHSNTANVSGGLPTGVLDVTSHPDVNELMLASDALVTDYSSIFFDYAVMRKPIYFLVPDLEKYKDSTRGFYVQLEEIAPGPLCPDTMTLVYELGQDFHARFGERLGQFLATYAPQDDGYAAARVVDALE